MIERDPSAHVRRPKQDDESSTLGLDRNELGAFLVQAGLCGGRDHALACLLALNGLRISEALGANIDNLDVNRGHRTLFIHRKGNKTATIPLSPRTARALDLYIGERLSGRIFVNHDGTSRLDRHASARIVRRLTKTAGIDKRISPHSLRHSFITAVLDAGVPRRDVQEAACFWEHIPAELDRRTIRRTIRRMHQPLHRLAPRRTEIGEHRLDEQPGQPGVLLIAAHRRHHQIAMMVPHPATTSSESFVRSDPDD